MSNTTFEMKHCYVFLCLQFLSLQGSCFQEPQSLISQTIRYKSTRPGEVYLVWTMVYWSEPGKKFVPEQSFFKKGMAWTKMNGVPGNFYITLTLPKNTDINFMFWVPIDQTGDSTDGWDTFGEQTYSSKFTSSKDIAINGRALWMPEKRFNMLESGSYFLGTAILLFISLMFLYRRRRCFSLNRFVVGLLCSAFIYSVVERMQMNHLFEEISLRIFGAVFNDLIWITACAVLFFIGLYFLRRFKTGSRIFAIVIGVLLLSSILFSILNIEIVRILGRPVNYQWLYYSDFLAGNDAKNALSSNLSGALVLNVIFLLIGAILLAAPFGFIRLTMPGRYKRWTAIIILTLLLGSYQLHSTGQFEKGRTENPILELISSTLIMQSSAKLFSMQISPEVKAYIENYHSVSYGPKFDSLGAITNIVLFVFESLPTSYVSIYDSSFNTTPNLARWKQYSNTYTNMYAHLPATVYSMGCINSGVYPLINFKSLIAEYPENSIPTVSEQLSNAGWKTSLFFGSDVVYSNIGRYALKHHFQTIEDNMTMPCTLPKFGNSNTFIDQLDDRCLATRYLQWVDSVKPLRTFSLIWTAQTHYPYFFRGEKRDFETDNDELNRYFNALHNSDEAFGALMDGLEKRGQLNNTLVMVTSDHGEAFGSHNQTVHATKIYEENIHVPLVVINPTYFHGSIDTTIHGLIDIPPSITHLIGIVKPKEWQGKSIFSTSSSYDDRTFFICPFSEFLFGTRHHDWKYIYNAEADVHELYDLKSDPNELKNVATRFPEIVKREKELLSAWVQYHIKRMQSLLGN